MTKETVLYQDMLEILKFFKYDFSDDEFESAEKVICHLCEDASEGCLDPVLHNLIAKHYKNAISCQNHSIIVNFYKDILSAA